MLDIEQNLLATFLVQIINGGGAGFLAFEAWKKLKEWWPQIKQWPTDLLRVSVVGSCIAIACGAFGLLGWLGVVTFPTTPQSWVTTLFSIAATAFMSSQLFHGRAKARR
jgi:hypothetical protein